jgi:hypothetical protein
MEDKNKDPRENIKTQIKSFIKGITLGMIVTEFEDNSRRGIRIGHTDWMEVGFFKDKHKNIPDDVIMFSCYVKLLSELTSALKDPDNFAAWVNNEQTKMN